ncbi:alpha/beta hydrolase [Nocardioides sp.]|uniref:alpha/beta fold hydrolase n=1 Tax=Nocardioides sp. TaxID=35761 RepID=UPI002ED2B525
MGPQQTAARGMFGNGMEYLSWGAGPRTLLFLPGGPGSGVPQGVTGRMARRWFDPFVEAGYTVWYVTRRRNMPSGHTVADMADDYARALAGELGGRVDLVVGESYGGMIALYLAARHGDACGRVAVVVAAVEVSDWGKEVDTRLATALAASDRTGVGTAFAEYALPGARSRWIRRVVAPWIARSLLSGKSYPPSDLLVETEAELAFDARPVLPEIGVPVVLLCGDSDRFFPQELVEETARMIPECTLVSYEGLGHMKAATSRQVPHDVLTFVDRG